MSRLLVLSCVAVAGLASVDAWAQPPYQLVEQRCTACHGSPPPDSPAPHRRVLAEFPPERILAAITTGPMAVHAIGLTDDQKRAIAEYMAGRPLGSLGAGHASAMKNQCAARPMDDPSRAPQWNGWSAERDNARFQTTAAGLTAEQVPRLKLKWAFGLPAATQLYGGPTIVGGRVFVGSNAGFVYSLDAATGCVYWSFEAPAGVRNVVVGPAQGMPGVRYAAYFGDLKANVYAVDAESGKLIWQTEVDPHFYARVTGAPVLDGDRLFVPVASYEETAGAHLTYECCTFRGSLVALDAKTGRQIWKSYSILEDPKPVRKNSLSVQQWGPAGGGIWSSPAIDVKRRAIYVGVGNAYTAPAAPTTDSIMAFDLDTGKARWWHQTTPKDAWVVGCRPDDKARTENCPDISLQIQPPAPIDADLAGSPIIRTAADGRTRVIAGQQNGMVYAVDPDLLGERVWAASVTEGEQGSITFGGAADAQMVYVTARGRESNQGVLSAFHLGTGERVWSAKAPLPPGCKSGADQGCSTAQNGAPAVIGGVVFAGSQDGRLRGYATRDGRVLWEFNTAQEFQTVNGVAAKGGALSGSGLSIAGGMLFVGSGYSNGPGNVLLAFGVE